MTWKERYGDTIAIRAENMFSNNWNIPNPARRLPMRLNVGGGKKLLFDRNHHRFFENFLRPPKTVRDPETLICLSQRYCEGEPPEPNFYEIKINGSIYDFMSSRKSLQKVRALRCTCASNRKAPSRLRSGTRCKHILLFERLKDYYLNNPPRQWNFLRTARTAGTAKKLLL